MPPVVVEMEVIRVEHRDVGDPRQIEQLELLALELDQAVAAQLLERAVDMDRRQAGRIGNVVLNQREVAPAVVRAAHRLQPQIELDEQMADPLIGAALAKVEVHSRWTAALTSSCQNSAWVIRGRSAVSALISSAEIIATLSRVMAPMLWSIRLKT